MFQADSASNHQIDVVISGSAKKMPAAQKLPLAIGKTTA
jgi:hypothetical protein